MEQNVQAPSRPHFYMINAGFAHVIPVRKLFSFQKNQLDFTWLWTCNMWSSYWQVKSSIFYFLSTSLKMLRKVLNQWKFNSYVFRKMSVTRFSERFRCSYSTLWKPLCDNPLIKLDLQDVFSSLEDDEDDETVYNYAGAKGLLNILIKRNAGWSNLLDIFVYIGKIYVCLYCSL